MKPLAFVIAALILTACGSAPEPAKEVLAPKPEPRRVMDHTSILMHEGQMHTEVIPDHILEMNSLPGGSLGEYKAKGKSYKLFVVDVETAQDAAILLIDVKEKELHDANYIAYMGGYFGQHGDIPVYVFAKTHYLAGVVGLPMKTADPIARTLAARLR